MTDQSTAGSAAADTEKVRQSADTAARTTEPSTSQATAVAP